MNPGDEQPDEDRREGPSDADTGPELERAWEARYGLIERWRGQAPLRRPPDREPPRHLSPGPEGG